MQCSLRGPLLGVAALLGIGSFACNHGTGLASKRSAADSGADSTGNGGVSVTSDAGSGGALTGGRDATGSSTGGSSGSSATGGTTASGAGAGGADRDAGLAGAGGVGGMTVVSRDGGADRSDTLATRSRDSNGVDAPAIESDGGGGRESGASAAVDSGRLACPGNYQFEGSLPSLPVGGWDLAMVDLNRDGRPDIVATSYGNDEVTVLLALGNGRFGPGKTYPTGHAPSDLALADVNSDGQLDILTANGFSQTVSVLLGKGDGSFASKIVSTLGSSADGLALGDLDGDGKLDLVTVSLGTISSVSTSSVSILLGSGDGTFSFGEQYAAGMYSNAVAVQDLNGDQVPDIVVFSAGTGTVMVMFGQGRGAFGEPKQQDCVGSANHMALGDFNNDEKPDIVTLLNGSPSQVCILLGKGDGTFAAPVLSAAEQPNRGPLTAVDINGDGNLDLVTASRVMLGQGDGTFVKDAVLPGTEDVSALAVADINGDARLDIAMSSSSVNLLLQAPDGTFGPEIPTYTAGVGASLVALGDLNRDGKLDVVTANDGSVSVLLGTGAGGLAKEVGYLVGRSPAALWLVDLDGDGALDIVTEVADGVLMGHGDGTFTTKSGNSEGLGEPAMALGDVNGDGRPDLIAITHMWDPQASVGVRLGIGDGSFASETRYDAGMEPAGVTIGDVDGDGTLDILVANVGIDGSYGSVSILLGNGDGTFVTAPALDRSSGPGWIALSDLDGNGKPDIMFGSPFSPIPLVYLGNGDGTFGHELDTGLHYKDTVTLADLDGDGRVDAVTTNTDNHLSVRFGNGDGTFAEGIEILLHAGGVAIGDLNGDGVPDVVGTNPDANAVFTLLGSCR